MVDLGKSDYSNHNRICQPLWKMYYEKRNENIRKV